MGRSGTLVLLRHGESTANAEGTFTGSRDVDLSTRGVRQSHRAAALMADAGIEPDVVVASTMVRARRTAEETLGAPPEPDVPVIATWRLNERDYGLLTGMPKTQVRERFGHRRFHTWRRTLHGRPPPLPEAERAALVLVPLTEDPQDPQTAAVPGEGESLHDVVLRVRPLWTDVVGPRVRAGATVLVIAHGNSLRALCAVVDALGEPELERLNLPTAQPIVYAVTPDGAASPRGGRYLDPETAAAEAVRIAAEGGT